MPTKKSKPSPKPSPKPRHAARLTPEQRATVLTRLAKGESQRAVATDLGVTHRTIQKVAAKAASPATPWVGLTKQLAEPAPEREPSPAPEAAPVEVDPNRRAIDALRSTLANAEAEASKARAIGNATLAQRYSRDIANIGIALGRLEKLEAEKDPDAITFSKDEYLEIEGELKELIHKHVQDRPLLCSDCGRKLAIRWGNGEA